MFPPPSVVLVAIPLLSSIVPVLGQGITCNATSSCPKSAPCCSEFGFCGSSSTFCLGGCNPLRSFSTTSCEPSPICRDANYNFHDNSRILTNGTFFNGNASQYDFIVDKGNIFNTNSSGGELALTLTKENLGTRISSTRYVHYGTITARLKTGRWGGVVTAFITMSDSKDEIDWEFPGNKTTQGQTNYFFLGVPDYVNGKTIDGLSDTFSNYHDYTLDWQPDTLRFLIDQKEVRRISKSDVQSHYPTTPARVQLSLWPSGVNTSAPGTVQWGGGMINFNDPDYTAAGHFYALVQSVSIKCLDPAGSVPEGAVSYVYGANTTANGLQIPSVTATNQTTIINGASALFTGVTKWALASVVFAGSALLL